MKNKAKCCQNLLLKELFFVHLGCSVASVITGTEPKFSVPSSEKNRTAPIFQEPNSSNNRGTGPIGLVLTERPCLIRWMFCLL